MDEEKNGKRSIEELEKMLNSMESPSFTPNSPEDDSSSSTLLLYTSTPPPPPLSSTNTATAIATSSSASTSSSTEKRTLPIAINTRRAARSSMQKHHSTGSSLRMDFSMSSSSPNWSFERNQMHVGSFSYSNRTSSDHERNFQQLQNHRFSSSFNSYSTANPPKSPVSPQLNRISQSFVEATKQRLRHNLFAVKVHLPRNVSTSILCDETTTVKYLKQKSLDKLKTILGVTVELNAAKLEFLSDPHIILDPNEFVENLSLVKEAKSKGESASFKLVCNTTRFSNMHIRHSASSVEISELDSKSLRPMDTVRSSSMMSFSPGFDFEPGNEIRRIRTDTLSHLRTASVLNLADSELNVNQAKDFIPCSMTQIKHLKPRSFMIEFLFVDDSNKMKLEVMGDQTVKEMKIKLWTAEKSFEVSDEIDDYRIQYVNANGEMVELFDEQQFVHTISIIQYWLMNELEFKFYVAHKRKNISKKIQAINKKIGNLIGYGLYRFDYLHDQEVDVFRRKMVSLRKEVISFRNEFHYNFPSDIDFSPITKSLNEIIGQTEKIHIRLHIPQSQMVKTLISNYTDSPDQIIGGFITRNKQLFSDSSIVDEFILKVCGREEFMYGPTPIINYTYIRSSLLKEEKINICLLSIKDRIIQDMASEQMEEFDPIEDPCVNLGTHSQLTIQGRKEDEIRTISLWDIARNYRVQIAACENLKVGNLESLYVEVGIYHGGVAICPVLRTHQVTAVSNPRWGAWLNFDIPCYNLPRTARLCITVWGRWNASKKMSQDRENDIFPIGWANMLLMDFKGYLKSGLTKISLWPGEKANPIGTCTCLQSTDEAAIFLRFDTFPHEVIFPTEVYSNEYADGGILLTLDEIDPLEEQKLDRIVESDPLTKLSDDDRQLVWKHRYRCLKKYQALPKLLQSARWMVLDDIIEVKKLLMGWAPMPPKAALELLDANYGDINVRECAVRWLEVLSDNQVMEFLLQLVQALKYEPYLDCALARFLLRRALNNKVLGHHFFWYLRSEMDDPSVSLRFSLMLEAYLRGSGMFMEDLFKQSDVLTKLLDVATVIKKAKNTNERKELLASELNKTGFPENFQIALDMRVEAKRLIVEKCKFMDSKKLPLWCVFENGDMTGEDIYVIFKSGDDLRQDMLTIQMIRIMDRLWRDDNLNLRMLPYNCISTGSGVGMIEVVLNAETVSNIQLSYGGSTAAFKDQPIDEWLRRQNPDSKDYERAVEMFTLSCAGYCVATYVLGIGDRHNDNIMVTKFGHLFHIDFGHFLGNIKTKFGFKRERAPFVLTPDFVYVMSKGAGTESEQFQKFVDYCVRAYLILRRNSHMFINLFAMMISTGIPELKSADDITYLRDALCLGKTEEEAAQEFRSLIFESLKLGWSTQLNWWLHNLVHGK